MLQQIVPPALLHDGTLKSKEGTTALESPLHAAMQSCQAWHVNAACAGFPEEEGPYSAHLAVVFAPATRQKVRGEGRGRRRSRKEERRQSLTWRKRVCWPSNVCGLIIHAHTPKDIPPLCSSALKHFQSCVWQHR